MDEAAVVHAASGDVYLTEDAEPTAGFYRYVPKTPGRVFSCRQHHQPGGVSPFRNASEPAAIAGAQAPFATRLVRVPAALWRATARNAHSRGFRTRSSVDTCEATDRQRAPGGGAAYRLTVSIGGFQSTNPLQFLLN